MKTEKTVCGCGVLLYPRTVFVYSRQFTIGPMSYGRFCHFVLYCGHSKVVALMSAKEAYYDDSVHKFN